MEHGECDIGLADVAGQQVLDVGLGKYTAARCNRIDVLGFFGQCVQLGSIDVQQTGGLVNERAGAARAVAVHADVGHPVFVKEDHLAVLATDVNEGAGLRERFFHQGGCRNHLLHERESPQLGVSHAHGAGDGHAQLQIAEPFRYWLHHCLHGLPNIHVVPPVIRKNRLFLCIQQHYFHRGGSDVYSYI